MAKGLIDRILDQIFDDEWVGRHGEKLTERELKWVQLFGRKGKTLRNVYLPKENGETSEVDVVFITQKGIFVMESKNYSGWIFGDELSQYWTAMLPNRQKNRFYNPIRQNRTHMKWMRSYVGDGVPLFSIIVFSERCELKKIELVSEDVRVIKRDRTYVTVREIWEQNPDVLTAEQVNEIYQRLKVLTNVNEAVKQAHVESIRKRFGTEETRGKQETPARKGRKQAGSAQESRPAEPVEPVKERAEKLPEVRTEQTEEPAEELPEVQTEQAEQPAEARLEQPAEKRTEEQAKQQTEQPEEQTKQQTEQRTEAGAGVPAAAAEMLCPRCGRKLVLRTARNGVHAGNQFYGCSGFPKCRYIRNI